MTDSSKNISIVTGGGRGIGRAISLRLGNMGHHVIVNYSRSDADATEVAETIRAKGGSAEPLQFDVSDSESVDAGIKAVTEKHGKISVLVNNAGIAVDGLLVRTKNLDWDRTIQVNLSGAFYCARAVAKSMMKERTGRIVNISSIIGEMGNAGQAAYSASKAGMIGLTKSLARELATRNITVNAVTPGYIVTDMTASLTEDIRTEMLKAIPLGKLGTAEDVAELVAFLCSPGASYITGQAIGVNGGMYM